MMPVIVPVFHMMRVTAPVIAPVIVPAFVIVHVTALVIAPVFQEDSGSLINNL